MIPDAWVKLSYLIPYTWGVHGYIHLQSMGASLWTTQTEYYALWILAAFWFAMACLSLFLVGWYQERKVAAAQPVFKRS